MHMIGALHFLRAGLGVRLATGSAAGGGLYAGVHGAGRGGFGGIYWHCACYFGGEMLKKSSL
jgi:hypothetical protein